LFHAVSDTLLALILPKTAPKHAFFASKKRKNDRFLHFKHQKMRFFAQKTHQKSPKIKEITLFLCH